MEYTQINKNWLIFHKLITYKETLFLRKINQQRNKNMFKLLEASEPMWVNLILNTIGVNSLRLGCLLLITTHDYYLITNVFIYFSKLIN